MASHGLDDTIGRGRHSQEVLSDLARSKAEPRIPCGSFRQVVEHMLERIRKDAGPASWFGSDQHPDEPRCLPAAQLVGRDRPGRLDLVAARQHRQLPGDARGDQSQANVLLNLLIELLDEPEATRNPRLVSPDAFRYAHLSQALVAVKRSDDPCLFEIGQSRATSVPLEDGHLCSRVLQVLHLSEDIGSAKPSQDSHSLEPVDQDQSCRLDPIRRQDRIFDLSDLHGHAQAVLACRARRP
jgi:hypothetical protein